MYPRTLCSFKLVVPHTCAGFRRGTLEWVKVTEDVFDSMTTVIMVTGLYSQSSPALPTSSVAKAGIPLWRLSPVFPLPGHPAFWGWISSFEGSHCGESCLCFFPKVGEFVLLLELSCHQYVTFYSLGSKGSSLSWDSCSLVLQMKWRNVEGHEIPCPAT